MPIPYHSTGSSDYYVLYMTDDKSNVGLNTAADNCYLEHNAIATILSQTMQDDAHNLTRQYCAGHDVWIGANWNKFEEEWMWYVREIHSHIDDCTIYNFITSVKKLWSKQVSICFTMS